MFFLTLPEGSCWGRASGIFIGNLLNIRSLIQQNSDKSINANSKTSTKLLERGLTSLL